MKKITLLAAVVATGLVCLPGFAQEKAPAKKKAAAAAAPAMPKPGPEMKELRDWAGMWTTDEMYEKSPFMPDGGTGAGSVNGRIGPGGFSVSIDVRSKNPMGSFTGHGVFSWDPDQKVYKAAWVDSMTPGIAMSTGHKEGDNLVFTGDAMMMGKKIAVKDVYSDRTPTSFTITSYMNDGTGEKKTMTMKVTKQEAPAAKK